MESTANPITSADVIEILGAKIDAQGTEIKAEIKALISRLDTLQRVSWMLLALLTPAVFGLLYIVITGS